MGLATAGVIHFDQGSFAGFLLMFPFHIPISSLIMVCELAGSYDLLVPLMLAERIAFVLLRKRFLYHAQGDDGSLDPDDDGRGRRIDPRRVGATNFIGSEVVKTIAERAFDFLPR